MSADQVELYSDMVKIGVPALVGLLAGLIPFLIERHKVSAQIAMEREKARQDIVLKFADALSNYTGKTTAYMAAQVTMSHHAIKNPNGKTDWKERVRKTGAEMLEAGVDRTKAKALAGILGKPEVLSALLDYDRCASEIINYYAASSGKVEKESTEHLMDELRKNERGLMDSLKVLL